MYGVVVRAAVTSIPMQPPLTRGAWDAVKAEVAAVNKEVDEVKRLGVSVEINDANKAGQSLRDAF
ncbi:hypothetical protein SAMD00023353_0104930 [Rosellinia necatrix]|uniref:Uncharacterized protein n=1 Tax=Rosellinia necatrix TaxID=77044 RepID=A0A1S8A5F1_ROSNE|nr:hypothetical protein SAMD00023353_0104930 [Rosellinia necatrix]